jgi:diacylglycerol kinase family enzyme
VVVGNDHTFLNALQVVAQHNCALGFLPVGENTLGALFGITDPLDGCNTLSRRITKQLPLGKANQTYFLNEATGVLPRTTQLRCNEQWNLITQTEQTNCTISNLSHAGGDHTQLQLLLEPQRATTSWLRKAKPLHPTTVVLTKVTIDHPETPVGMLLDGTTMIKSPITFTLKSKAIKVIVGKQRNI